MLGAPGSGQGQLALHPGQAEPHPAPLPGDAERSLRQPLDQLPQVLGTEPGNATVGEPNPLARRNDHDRPGAVATDSLQQCEAVVWADPELASDLVTTGVLRQEAVEEGPGRHRVVPLGPHRQGVTEDDRALPSRGHDVRRVGEQVVGPGGPLEAADPLPVQVYVQTHLLGDPGPPGPVTALGAESQPNGGKHPDQHVGSHRRLSLLDREDGARADMRGESDLLLVKAELPARVAHPPAELRRILFDEPRRRCLCSVSGSHDRAMIARPTRRVGT